MGWGRWLVLGVAALASYSAAVEHPPKLLAKAEAKALPKLLSKVRIPPTVNGLSKVDTEIPTSAALQSETKEAVAGGQPAGSNLILKSEPKDGAPGGLPAGSQNGLRLSVCIPCIPRDVDSTLHRLLSSVQEQTVPANEVVIALSESSKEDGEKIQKELGHKFPKLENLRVLPTPAKMSPGANRNRAAREATGDLFSFIDADDEMHPEKVAVMKSLFEQTGTKCALHSYVFKRDRPMVWGMRGLDWHTARQADGVDYYKGTNKKDNHSPSAQVELKYDGVDNALVSEEAVQQHQGHPTCRKEVFQKTSYDEEALRAEDCRFLRSVLSVYGPNDHDSLRLIDLPLTIYYPSDHPDNAWTNDLQAQAKMKALLMQSGGRTSPSPCEVCPQFSPEWSGAAIKLLT